MNNINLTVAEKLKQFRSDKGWSLDVTSQHCGVSKAMLGQIERGESSPTIAKLWQIATGFSVPLSAFISPLPEAEKGIDEETVTIKTLFDYDINTGMEVFELWMAAGHEQRSQAHQRGVIEHIVVIAGEMQYGIGEEWTTLQTGESAKFDADQPHAYRNCGELPLRFMNIVNYPNKEQRKHHE